MCNSNAHCSPIPKISLLHVFSYFCYKRYCSIFKTIKLNKMVVLVSRTGRHLQRYNKGRRLVVGCIPYRYKDGALDDEFEVLLISSQRGQGMLFPKGGWELDESAKEAASRETLEEAGVLGNVERELGRWRFKSKSLGIFHEGCMFPLLVEEQLDQWPEKNVRKREWMTVSEAREVCQHWWMKEALDKLVDRLMASRINDDEDVELQSV